MSDSDDKPVKGNLKLLLEKFESMKTNNDKDVNRPLGPNLQWS